MMVIRRSIQEPHELHEPHEPYVQTAQTIWIDISDDIPQRCGLYPPSMQLLSKPGNSVLDRSYIGNI